MELGKSFRLSWKTLKFRQGTGRTQDEITSTVGAASSQAVLQTFNAERTLKRADARALIPVRQVAIAAFTIRPESKRHVVGSCKRATIAHVMRSF